MFLQNPFQHHPHFNSHVLKWAQSVSDQEFKVKTSYVDVVHKLSSYVVTGFHLWPFITNIKRRMWFSNYIPLCLQFTRFLAFKWQFCNFLFAVNNFGNKEIQFHNKTVQSTERQEQSEWLTVNMQWTITFWSDNLSWWFLLVFKQNYKL